MIPHPATFGCLLALSGALAAQTSPAPADLAPPMPSDGVDGGSGTAVPAQLDDSVPLPIRRVAIPSDGGDQILADASGDPYFLGFVAGSYYPPADEALDPELVGALRTSYDDGRPAAETFGFVMFERRITAARLDEIRALGARVLGFHPHYCVKVAVPVGAVEQLAALDFVRWVGVPRAWQKLHPALARALQESGGGAIDVYVDVYDSDANADTGAIALAAPQLFAPGEGVSEGAADEAAVRWRSNGWQEAQLAEFALEVREYVDSIRAFRLRIDPAQIQRIAELDFVQFVEPDLAPAVSHDESMPMINSDLTRASYDGGAGAVAGFADTGYYSQHQDLNGAFGVGWDLTNTTGAYVDGCGHGSHVLGTLRGEGDVDPSHRGSARGIGSAANRRLFAVRIFDDNCTWAGASIATILDKLDSSYFDGMFITPRPHVTNHSWGTAGLSWVGSEAAPRTIDNEVYDNLQLHVWAAGNGGAVGSISLEATAKNALTVGSVCDDLESAGDPGTLSVFSNRGPCGDGRWKPNVVAPGEYVTSVGNATPTSYATKGGTSMAAPHVSGLAAQLCEHYSWLRYAPHRLASLMMATSLTKDDVALGTPTVAHLDQYGTGRVEAYRAHHSTSQMQWTNSGWDQTNSNWVYGDFTVNTGCTRLVICITYQEPASSSGASKALVNDFDLYIDSPSGGIDPAGNTGEYVAHQSALDNTEIRMINNPPVGAWRFKVWPEDVPGSAHVGATVVQLYGDTTPDGTLSLSISDQFVHPLDDVSITATVSNPSYVASAVFLDTTSSFNILQASTTTLADGAVTDLMNNGQAGRDVLLGDILHGSSRSATWTARWYNEGIHLWTVEARSDNWVDDSQYVSVTVDGTGPGVVTGLSSTTHTPNVWSNQTNITYVWTGAPDNLSGIDGYGISTTPTAALPSMVMDIEALPLSYAETLAPGTWYFNIRALDNCANWSASYANVGPFKIDPTPPSGPTNLHSTTHAAGVQSCSTNVGLLWNAATDGVSGLEGYLGVWNTQAVFDPTGATNLAPGATSSSADIGSSSSARYFHLRAKDLAGNYGPTAHFGPVFADANSVSTYCTAKTNSLGCAPTINSFGIPSKSAGNFTVACAGAINNKLGLLFWGSTATAVPFQDGWKCVANPVLRTPVLSSGGTTSGNNCTGSYAFVFDAAYMTQTGIDLGDTVHAQWWMRDPGATSTTGLSNAIRFTVCE